MNVPPLSHTQTHTHTDRHTHYTDTDTDTDTHIMEKIKFKKPVVRWPWLGLITFYHEIFHKSF